MVLIKRMIFLTSTTPAAATASAFPSSAGRGACYLARSITSIDPIDGNQRDAGSLNGKMIFVSGEIGAFCRIFGGYALCFRRLPSVQTSRRYAWK